MTLTHVESLFYSGERLSFGGCYLDELSTKYKTPLYVYNFDLVTRRVNQLKSGLGNSPNLICYAVKANSSLALLKHLASLGVGADVVSGGELRLALKAGIDPQKIVFSGVAKTQEEIDLGVNVNILTFNVESPSEIRRIADAARSAGRICDVTLRINPDIDAKTHPKIATGLHATKFGLDPVTATNIAQKILQEPLLSLGGVSCHIGSQILDIAPLLDAAKFVKDFASSLRQAGHKITRLDLGGGLGVAYHPNDLAKFTDLETYGRRMTELVSDSSFMILLEPGRSLVAESGILISRVIDVKQTAEKNFLLVDAGMNDLIRPSLYEAYHHVFPVWQHQNSKKRLVDIVGPVCETGDYFALDREIHVPMVGESIAIAHAGAYGFSMASNYNMRPKPAEVGILNGQDKLIRKREAIEDLLGG